MTDIQQTTDAINWEVDKNKLPSTLNVLTILTFIGSGLALISTIWGLFKAPPSETDLQEMQDKLDKAPDFIKSFSGSHLVELTRKSMENRIPIMVLSLVALGLCIYGAIQMRDRKKLGFYLYVIGELFLPFISMAIFIGLDLYGGFALGIAILIPAVFIILYASQLKHLS